jgi:hypothetical protein
VIPGKPANPILVVLDTSVLLQLIATDQLQLLRYLRSEYKVQPAIATAVESETLQILMTVAKFRGRQEQFKKALSNNTISLIDQQSLSGLLGTGVDALLRQIDSEGRRLHLRVDRGEAYTHAAASVLGVPVATNDITAVNRLLRDGENIPRPVLRLWDFIVFGRQVGQLDDAMCDKTRQTLATIQERLPQCFVGRTFSVGVTEFYARLVDGVAPLIGAAQPEGALDERQVLFRSSPPSP